MTFRRSLLLMYNRLKRSKFRRLKRFYPLATINKLLIHFLKSRNGFVEVKDLIVFLDREDALQLSIDQDYEPLVTAIMKKLVKEGDIVVDIGAHIGYHTLNLAKLVGRGEVFAFEPEPNNFSLLKKNVYINGFKNVILEQKAVTHHTGKVKLWVSNISSGDHRIWNPGDRRKFVWVEAVSLDDYFQERGFRISLIKMDIQGAEGEAIQGMINLLQYNKNIKLILEFWPEGLKRFGKDPSLLLRLLVDLGFKLYWINGEEEIIKPVTIPELLDICKRNPKVSLNLLCSRQNIDRTS